MLQDPWAGLMQQYMQQAAGQQSVPPDDDSDGSAHAAAGHSMSEVFDAAAEVKALGLNIMVAVFLLASPVVAQKVRGC